MNYKSKDEMALVYDEGLRFIRAAIANVSARILDEARSRYEEDFSKSLAAGGLPMIRATSEAMEELVLGVMRKQLTAGDGDLR